MKNDLQVVKITVLLPNVLSSTNENKVEDIWTKENRHDLVLPGIILAAQDKSQKSFATFHDILPGWRIDITAADTICDSTIGPLEAVRLHCNTGGFLSNSGDFIKLVTIMYLI